MGTEGYPPALLVPCMLPLHAPLGLWGRCRAQLGTEQQRLINALQTGRAAGAEHAAWVAQAEKG